MLYTFAAGIRILDTATYSSLTTTERTEARELLFKEIQPVVDAMGSFDTDKPDEFLKSHLAAKAGPEWGVGAALEVGTWYYINPVTGERICVRDYALERDGAEMVVAVQVGGKDLKSAFFVQQTAIN
jgi:hypothetical protein